MLTVTARACCDVKASAAVVVQHPIGPYLKCCALLIVSSAQEKMNGRQSRGALLVGPGDTG